MKKTKPIPTDIGDYISYDPETGVCRWKQQPSRAVKVGSLAGNIDNTGYKRVQFKGSNYLIHRIAWFLHYGEQPNNLVIDHVNGNKDDNRISNLRLVTQQVNVHNTRFKGICWNKQKAKWTAQIHLDKKSRHLGTFDCPLMAGLAYKDAKKQLHPTAVR